MKPAHKTTLLWTLLLLAVVALYQVINDPKGQPPRVWLSELLDDVQAGKVERVRITLPASGQAGTFQATLRGGKRVSAEGPLSDSVLGLLRDEQVPFDVKVRSDDVPWSAVSVVVVFAICVLFFFMLKR